MKKRDWVFIVGVALSTGVSVASDGFQLAQIKSMRLKACGGLWAIAVGHETRSISCQRWTLI